MKNLIIIILLFISFNTYAQVKTPMRYRMFEGKGENKGRIGVALNFKPSTTLLNKIDNIRCTSIVKIGINGGFVVIWVFASAWANKIGVLDQISVIIDNTIENTENNTDLK